MACLRTRCMPAWPPRPTNASSANDCAATSRTRRYRKSAYR
jgi:hypothetical protein